MLKADHYRILFLQDIEYILHYIITELGKNFFKIKHDLKIYGRLLNKFLLEDNIYDK